MLTDIPISQQVIFGDTVSRRLLATQLRFTDLDFGRKSFTLILPVFYYKPEQAQQFITDPEGNQVEQLVTIDRPYVDPRFSGRNGLLQYRIDVSDNHLVNVATGRAPVAGEENATVIGEFSYLRMALNDVTLESLLMVYLQGLVTEGALDANHYPILQSQ
jgi:hypothetical protein